MIQVEITLVRNSKAMGYKPFFAVVKPDGELEFLRAVIPKYGRSGAWIGGTFEVPDDSIVVYREDTSSHKHASCITYLARIKNGEIENIAWVEVEDRNHYFNPPELKEIYAEVRKKYQNNYIVNTLVEYAKKQGLLAVDMKKERARELKQLLEKAREIAKELELHNLEAVLADIISTINDH